MRIETLVDWTIKQTLNFKHAGKKNSGKKNHNRITFKMCVCSCVCFAYFLYTHHYRNLLSFIEIIFFFSLQSTITFDIFFLLMICKIYFTLEKISFIHLNSIFFSIPSIESPSLRLLMGHQQSSSWFFWDFKKKKKLIVLVLDG